MRCKDEPDPATALKLIARQRWYDVEIELGRKLVADGLAYISLPIIGDLSLQLTDAGRAALHPTH